MGCVRMTPPHPPTAPPPSTPVPPFTSATRGRHLMPPPHAPQGIGWCTPSKVETFALKQLVHPRGGCPQRASPPPPPAPEPQRVMITDFDITYGEALAPAVRTGPLTQNPQTPLLPPAAPTHTTPHHHHHHSTHSHRALAGPRRRPRMGPLPTSTRARGARTAPFCGTTRPRPGGCPSWRWTWCTTTTPSPPATPRWPAT